MKMFLQGGVRINFDRLPAGKPISRGESYARAYAFVQQSLEEQALRGWDVVEQLRRCYVERPGDAHDTLERGAA